MGRPRKHQEVMRTYGFKISARHLFALKIISRTSGRAEASVLEEAIERTADFTSKNLSCGWRDVYDHNQAVAWLRLFAMPEFHASASSVGEVERVEFIREHAVFFYSDKGKTIPRVAHASILWEHLDELVKEWQTTKRTNYYGVAKKMAALLKKAQLDPPPFGPEASAK